MLLLYSIIHSPLRVSQYLIKSAGLILAIYLILPMHLDNTSTWLAKLKLNNRLGYDILEKDVRKKWLFYCILKASTNGV